MKAPNPKPMKPTASVIRALKVVKANPDIRPREFARKMWPDSDGWNRSARSGEKGSHRGGGMYLAGGGYLGKLYNAGLLYVNFHQYGHGYSISPEGRKMLMDQEAKNAQA